MSKIGTKTALITGSSSGIGEEIAITLSKKGYNVFLTGRREEKLVENAQKLEGNHGFLAGDLSDLVFCKKLINTVEDEFGQIDILVNNAGEYVWSKIENTELSQIHRVTRLNLEVPYFLSSLVVPSMKQNKWGRIINIGSISGAVGEANASLYSASKAGLIGMTKSLGLELAEYGITVNTINPGWVKTDLTNEQIENEVIDEQEQLDMIPQHRWISTDEVADLVAYLASDSAKGLTGQSINLCAGLSIG